MKLNLFQLKKYYPNIHDALKTRQFEKNNICGELAKQTDNVFTHISIKIAPPTNIIRQTKTIKTAHNSGSSLSKQTAEHLLSISKKAPKGLKEKIEKLAKHAKN